jgi:hypothetical protein
MQQRMAKIALVLVALLGATCGCYAQSHSDMELLRSAEFEGPRSDRSEPYGLVEGRQTLSPAYHATSALWWVWQNGVAPDVAAPGGYSDTNANYFKALVEEYGLLRALFLYPDRIVRNTKIGRASSPKNERGLIDDNPKRYRR